MKRKLDPWEHCIAGTLAGLVSTVSLFPLDTIKVRYQVDERTTIKAPQRLFDAFQKVVRREGWQGLYQGLSAGVWGASLSWGGYFFFYERAKLRWLANREHESAKVPHDAWHQMAASSEAGVIMVALTNPIWLVKTRMQLQLRQRVADAAPVEIGQRPYRGFLDALTTIGREEGPLALYKGSIPALMLVSHGVVQFVVYERLKMEVSTRWPDSGKAGGAAFLGMGAAAKIVASVATYPIQVVKTRLQQRRLDNPPAAAAAAGTSPKWTSSMLVVGTQAQYRGVVDCVAKTWRVEGAYGFYKGCFPNAIRVAPGAAITFYTYEMVSGLLRSR